MEATEAEAATAVADENTNPEDWDYAKEVAADIRTWALERYVNKSLDTFRQTECKEQFMKISERFISMACKVLVDNNFLVAEGKSRIPVFTLTSSAKEVVASKLDIASPPKPKKTVKRKRKVIQKSAQGTDEEIEVEEDVDDDSSSDSDEPVAKRLSSTTTSRLRDQPFALMYSDFVREDEEHSNLVVNDVAGSRCSVPGNPVIVSTSTDHSWAVLSLLSRHVDFSTQTCSYVRLLEVAVQEMHMEQQQLDDALSQLEQQNKLMRIDGDLLLI